MFVLVFDWHCKSQLWATNQVSWDESPEICSLYSESPPKHWDPAVPFSRYMDFECLCVCVFGWMKSTLIPANTIHSIAWLLFSVSLGCPRLTCFALTNIFVITVLYYDLITSSIIRINASCLIACTVLFPKVISSSAVFFFSLHEYLGQFTLNMNVVLTTAAGSLRLYLHLANLKTRGVFNQS